MWAMARSIKTVRRSMDLAGMGHYTSRRSLNRGFQLNKHTGSLLRNALILAMSLNLVSLGFVPAAHAEVIGTPTFSQSLSRDARLDRINGFLAQDSVRGQLIGLGVDPADAQARVAALTDSELQMLDQRIDSMPAGGDGFLAVIGVVFIVLLILELTGVINIFKKF
jgi:hypothetical protein